MSQIETQTEPCEPATILYRTTTLSPEEYDRETRNFTKQELKRARLYYQHSFHFFVLSAREKITAWSNKRNLLFFGFALAALFLACLFVGPKQATEGGSLVPIRSFAQRVKNAPGELYERLRVLLGRGKKDLLLPEDVLSKNAPFNASETTPSGNTPDSKVEPEQATQQESPQETQKIKDSAADALVDGTGSFLPQYLSSKAYQGMDIFTFAFCVARDFAAHVFGSFGWSNGTNA